MAVEASEAGCFGFCICTTLMGLVFLLVSTWEPQHDYEMGTCVAHGQRAAGNIECVTDIRGGPPSTQLESGTIILESGRNATCKSLEVQCIGNALSQMQAGKRQV